MGLRGPQPTPTAILKLRGSYRPNYRKAEAEPEPEDGVEILERIVAKYGLKRRPMPETWEVPAKWRELFQLIPGYDPIATAEDCWFDVEDAERVVEFHKDHLSHIEGSLAGRPFELMPWQSALRGCAFGWKRPDGTRRYREVFEYVARKNGKSSEAGALVDFVAICDDEPGAQLYSSAAERDQAALVFRQAKGMIYNSAGLTQLCKIFASYKSIEYPFNRVYKALSADANTKHGFNSHFVVNDELHAQPNRELIDVLQTSTGARDQPMVWHITTADFKRESICNEKYKYACDVRDGVIQDVSFLPAIWEAQPEDDWKSPDVWAKANPNLGVSVSLEYLQRECQRAQDVPAYENTFKRLHLNIQTEQDIRAIPMDQWNACAAEYTLDNMAGKTCFAGLDLSNKVDVTALVLVFPDEGRSRLWPIFFVPQETAKMRERQNKTRFDEWIRRGHMQTTPGNSIDHAFIRRTINEVSQKVFIRKIAFDPWNCAQLATELGEQDGFEMVEFRQGFVTMTEPTKMLLADLADEKLQHPNNPCLNWMAANMAVDEDAAGNLKPSKKKSTEKIDGIVAAIMGKGLAALEPAEGPQLIFL